MYRPDQTPSPMCLPRGGNRFCGKLPIGHDEVICHNESEKKRRILQEMKKIMSQLDQMPVCDQWDTSITKNNTKGPFRFGIYDQGSKPWAPGRVKSQELLASRMIRFCECQKRNGLQDDCRRFQCRGRPLCMVEPFPECPPFTKIPKEIIDPDPWQECKNRPWERYKEREGDRLGGY